MLHASREVVTAVLVLFFGLVLPLQVHHGLEAGGVVLNLFVGEAGFVGHIIQGAWRIIRTFKRGQMRRPPHPADVTDVSEGGQM